MQINKEDNHCFKINIPDGGERKRLAPVQVWDQVPELSIARCTRPRIKVPRSGMTLLSQWSDVHGKGNFVMYIWELLVFHKCTFGNQFAWTTVGYLWARDQVSLCTLYNWGSTLCYYVVMSCILHKVSPVYIRVLYTVHFITKVQPYTQRRKVIFPICIGVDMSFTYQS